MTDIHATPTIRDDREHSRFVIDETGGRAHLTYRAEPGRLVLIHTEVPDDFAGQGLGAALVRAALDRVRAEGLTLAPWCPFARRWLRQHFDALAGVKVDWSAPPQDT